jgi:hypothetical protein
MKILLFIFSIISIANFTIAQNDSLSQNKDLKIYYDCQFCDLTFIKQNLKYVQFMRDRKFADVHLLITQQTNGSGGNQIMLRFIGRNEFIGINDTLIYSTNPTQTDDEKRRLQLKYVEFGLVRYFIKKGLINQINLEFQEPEVDTTSVNASIKDDPWKYFVFNVSAGGWINGQETSRSTNGNSSFSVKRVTDKNKFLLYNSLNINTSKFIFDEETITSYRQSLYTNISDIITITDHWSYGFFGKISNTIYSNYRISSDLKGGLEYNLFPYSKSAVKQLSISYKIGGGYNDYYDTTLFDKTEELLLSHTATIGGSIKQKWGSLSASVDYQNYFHDFDLNAFNFYLNFNIRLFKGFSWYLNGNYSISHNQINIRKPSGLSQNDLLLQQKQFKSGYSYWMSTGLSYSFGSIYNTIVNPRFNF